MDTKITEIEILLDKLNLLFSSIKTDGIIDKVEMELLKKYVQQLQDKLHIPSELKKEQPVIVPVPKVEQVNPESEKTIIPEIEIPIPKAELPEMVAKEQEKKELRNDLPEEKLPEIEMVKEAQKITEKIAETIIPVVEKEQPKKEELPVINKSPEVKPPMSGNEKKPLALLDEEEDDEEFNAGLNNKLFKDKKTLADKLTSSKGKELKSVIDLNEKLFFISKLFKGDKDAYENTIKQLNAVSSFEEGKKLITSELSTKYQWKDAEAIERLTEVIQQKFM